MKKAKLMIYFLNDQEIFEITYAQKILVRRAIEATLEYESYKFEVIYTGPKFTVPQPK